MNNQEREVISDIFRRLEQAANQPRDPETERFIAEKIRQQPYAPYAMAQLIYVQEEAIKSLNQQLEQARAQPDQGRGQEGGFLSSIFGGGAQRSAPRPDQRPMAAPAGQGAPQSGPWGGAPQAGPWGGAQQPGPMGGGMMGGGMMGGGMQPQAGGGGFLRGALTTAAGVAGGMVAGNALMNAFGGGHHQTLGGFGNSDAASLGGGGETIIENNYFGSDPNAAGGGYGDLSPFPDQGGPGVQDASFDSNDDLGGDFGGDGDGGDWT